MMKLASLITLLLSPSGTTAFSPSLLTHQRTSIALSHLNALTSNNDEISDTSRRQLFAATAVATTALLLPATSQAATQTVVVAGATGQTGRRILERLASQPGVAVVAGVRNVEKATKSLSESSTVVRGAMIQKVPSLDAAGVELRRLDGEFLLYIDCCSYTNLFDLQMD
jgi:hypothetical protein